MSDERKTQKPLREVLHSSIAFIRGVEANKAIAGLTLDHLIQEQISTYKQGEERSILDATGASVGKRISKIDELTNLESDLKAAISAVRSAGKDKAKLRALGIYEVDEP